MSIKSRTIQALRKQRYGRNFWVLLKQWKDENKLPDEFSVLVAGPPKTWKSRIITQFKRYWPECRAVERVGVLRAEHIAGFDIIIQTHRMVHELPNGLSTNFEAVSISKCRFFPSGQTFDPVNFRPNFLDIVPFVDASRPLDWLDNLQ